MISMNLFLLMSLLIYIFCSLFSVVVTHRKEVYCAFPSLFRCSLCSCVSFRVDLGKNVLVSKQCGIFKLFTNY